MLRRLALPLLAVVAGLTGACGSEKVDVSDQPAGGVAYPTGADQVVVRLSTGGGFVPEGADFRTPPDLLIMGDGTVFLPGAQISIFPAPLLPAISTATLDPDGLRAVLDAADKAGLLKAPPSYEPASGAAQVADAPTTSLQINANGQTFDHRAYTLGFQPNGVESTPERNALDRFVTQLKDLTALVGAEHLTADEVYTPERFGVIAQRGDPRGAGADAGPDHPRGGPVARRRPAPRVDDRLHRGPGRRGGRHVRPGQPAHPVLAGRRDVHGVRPRPPARGDLRLVLRRAARHLTVAPGLRRVVPARPDRSCPRIGQ